MEPKILGRDQNLSKPNVLFYSGDVYTGASFSIERRLMWPPASSCSLQWNKHSLAPEQQLTHVVS